MKPRCTNQGKRLLLWKHSSHQLPRDGCVSWRPNDMSKCKAPCSSLSQSAVPFVHGKKRQFVLQVAFQVKGAASRFQAFACTKLEKDNIYNEITRGIERASFCMATQVSMLSFSLLNILPHPYFVRVSVMLHQLITYSLSSRGQTVFSVFKACKKGGSRSHFFPLVLILGRKISATVFKVMKAKLLQSP